ncbi:MAG: HPr family phosphocarrier protein [Treponema sp.]|nr:HPr family phosphocarrier protein [Treponema sp.]
MYSKITRVINPTGIHARPAHLFVKKAKSYKSNITVKKTGTEGPPTDAKSIVMVLAQTISTGTEVEITAEGEDEVQAVDAMVDLIESAFGEIKVE